MSLNDSGEMQRLYRRDQCQRCLQCVQECFSGALVQIGKPYDVSEILVEIERDLQYYHFGQGGVTFSGGEPLLQADFLKVVLTECRQRGIHCAVDTAGNVAWSILAEVIPLVDLFLYDIKAFNEESHRQATGAGNRRILENLQRLADSGREIWIRIPVIPGVNDTEEEMRSIANFLAPLPGIRWVELLPFHTLGSEKYASLGRDYPAKGIAAPTPEKMNLLQAAFEQSSLAVRIMK